jgi:hypothetical protein
MATTHWGRKETIIFPPHSPIYSYGAVFLAFVLTGCFVYLRFNFGQTPLQQFYTPIYARSAAGGAFNKTDKYQLLYAAGVSVGVEVASDAAAQARGLDVLYRGPEQKYVDARLHTYLQNAVYGGEQLRDIYKLPLLFGFLSLLAQLPVARGFVYLAAVVDWFSRRVLAWRLAITMETTFCIEALEEALSKNENRRYSTPTRAVSPQARPSRGG